MIILMVFVCGLKWHGEQSCRKLPEQQYQTVAACEAQAQLLQRPDVGDVSVTALCARPPS